ncbi:hypothetical protein, partial [Lactobacillus delbrueckii]|uniref:hypothetical protein n=1 Tax=Lactobacillus delbrueckii TaxID=1584 RepID=UPI0021A2A561
IAITSSLIEYLLAKLLSFQGFIVIFGVGSLSSKRKSVERLLRRVIIQHQISMFYWPLSYSVFSKLVNGVYVVIGTFFHDSGCLLKMVVLVAG